MAKKIEIPISDENEAWLQATRGKKKKTNKEADDDIAERVATKFRTRKELQDYLHEHPDAERSEHSVMSPSEAHKYYEDHKKDASIAERVAEDFMGAPKKAPAPKSYPATAHLIEQLKKVHGLERVSATINSPILMAEEAAKAVAGGKVHLVVPKDYQGPGGTVIQGVDNLPVQMSRHPSSGNFEGNKPGHATFDFVVLTRDKRGKEVQLPLEGVHLFMQWLPVYRSEGVGGGGLGHRYIDRLFVSEVGTHATKLEGKLQHLLTWYAQTYGHEPELVKAASTMTERVAERYLGMTAAKIDPYVGSAVRHSINFLQEAEGLLKRPVEMHGVSAEQQVSNVLKSTVELIQLALKKLPPPTAR